MFKLRFWWVVFWAFIGKRGVSTSHLRFWVTPFDCDLNLHLNNASYLKYMDLGRWDLVIRQGVVRGLFREGLKPAAVRIEIDFKRALPPGTFFTLDTGLDSFTEKSFKLRQTFKCGDEIVADALVTAVFIHKGRAAPVEKFLDLLPGRAGLSRPSG
jgi:acyl-CoA thioesterase FadM